MFVDKVEVKVKAGNGGNGIVSFRHEKFIDKGGPDGGDGGKGGDVIFVASRNQNTLAAFRYNKLLKAKDGADGGKRKMHGKMGADLVVQLPVGTEVVDEDNKLVVDLTDDNQKFVVAAGGKGGFGNAHFTSSRRQAPRVAEKGELGEDLTLKLELKMIADVGLVGLPNAGKSTLLATVSNARPEIADYPFTTLKPNLGVVDIDSKSSLLIADIPGLIEGASKGKGLGDEFLRHIERTSILVHLIDVYSPDIAKSYKTIQEELKSYKINLSKKPQLVVLSKVDGLDKKMVNSKLTELQKAVPASAQLYSISSKSREGISELIYELEKLVKTQKKKAARSAKRRVPVLRFMGSEDSWEVKKSRGKFIVTGRKIERFAQRTDFNSIAGVERLRDIMSKMGILKELEKQNIEPGQEIYIGKKRHHKIEF